MLRAGFVLLAQKLQEAADITHSDVRIYAFLGCGSRCAPKGLAHGRTTSTTPATARTGDCIYSADGKMKKAPYELTKVGGKLAANLDTANAESVSPTSTRTYQSQADDDDHYCPAMMESFKTAKLYTEGELPLFERFISKADRNAASEDSFAGKGKSYPILKPGDVGAAVHAMGRAGSGNYGMAQLKANIVRIAKAKGWSSELPKAWRGDAPASESDKKPATGVRLVESAVAFPSTFDFKEASNANPMVKIINEGRGTSGYYTKKVLERDGPKIFTPGTLMYINHATPAAEAQRPEGDWNKLAAVTTGKAFWDDNGKDGPALYAPAKVFSNYATQVAEKAPHTGVSIRASGSRDDKAIAPDEETRRHHRTGLRRIDRPCNQGRARAESS